jgi:hypothetical protein
MRFYLAEIDIEDIHEDYLEKEGARAKSNIDPQKSYIKLDNNSIMRMQY